MSSPTKVKESDAEHGIIILEPYATEIIRERKQVEYRNRKIPKQYLNMPLYLLSQARIYGIIIFDACRKIKDNDFEWQIRVIQDWEDRPKYNHPGGAQVWVRNVNRIQMRLELESDITSRSKGKVEIPVMKECSASQEESCKCFLCGNDKELELYCDQTGDDELLLICFKCWFSDGDLQKTINRKKWGDNRL